MLLFSFLQGNDSDFIMKTSSARTDTFVCAEGITFRVSSFSGNVVIDKYVYHKVSNTYEFYSGNTLIMLVYLRATKANIIIGIKRKDE